MRIRQVVLLLALILALSNLAGAQSRRLIDLTDRLSDEASRLAEDSYSDYAGGYRTSRSDVDAMMLAQQFNGAVSAFRRMVNDRRRTTELRDAAGVLQDLARQADRYSQHRSRWYEAQRLVSDIVRETGSGGTGPYDPFPDDPRNRRSGKLTWKGRVDHDVHIQIRDNSAEVLILSGDPASRVSFNFSSPLPRRPANVVLNLKKGRGEVILEQLPSRENGYTVLVRIRDLKGGSSDYEFELTW